MADQEKTTIAVSQRGISLTTIDDMFRFAKCVAASGLAPKGHGHAGKNSRRD
ncbi:MAG: hypothetical protein KatS3mg038_1257 [Candidatus Kapaibacterium sp.]|nr:MAG: hypothetical protein KatS3mg038_1257 [Candidatus Kapabacteria bacterium]